MRGRELAGTGQVMSGRMEDSADFEMHEWGDLLPGGGCMWVAHSPEMWLVPTNCHQPLCSPGNYIPP